MRIQLSDHFTYRRLLRFVASPVLMMLCTSVYGIVDGFFVSNYVGKTPFAAVNLIIPISMGIGSIGFLVGTGGSAVVSKTLGEGKPELANQYFSMLIWVSTLFSAAVSLLGLIFAPSISRLLGAEGELLNQCIIYGRISFGTQTLFVLQSIFQNFFVTAERPDLSLKTSVLAGLTNMVLDYLLIAVIPWGVAGAAIATALGQAVGAAIPLIYFTRKNDSLLRLSRAPVNWRILWQVCTNGSSELVTNISISVVNILYNFQLMRIAGEDGVAAFGIIMYVNFMFMAIYLGYSIGSAPVIGYHYGADNQEELKNLFRKSLTLMVGTGVLMTLLAELFSSPLVAIFAGYDLDLFTMTCRGFQLYAPAFLFMGVNVWGSSFFTALNNGGVSAAISFLRMFVFQITTVLILPVILEIDGIWLAVAVAELLALLVTVFFFIWKRNTYHYF
ncbi:MAG: MATE family efflux transporter [Oscillospiraceae bacterium]|nr:MATE family efflux transporter [Oscillospiraceae bacterium]